MQYVLLAMWERRQQGYLTVEAYHAIGGVTGSLATDAEACFARLPAADRDTAMAILLRLVRVTLDGAFVRRVAALDELIGIGPAEQCPKDIERARCGAFSRLKFQFSLPGQGRFSASGNHQFMAAVPRSNRAARAILALEEQARIRRQAVG